MCKIKYPCRECNNDTLLPIPGHDLAECSKCGYPNDIPTEVEQEMYLDGLAKGQDVSGADEPDEEYLKDEFQRDIDRMAHDDDYRPLEGDYAQSPEENPEC